MPLCLCSDGHNEICFDGEADNCAACDLKETLAETRNEVEDLKDQIADLKEGAQ